MVSELQTVYVQGGPDEYIVNTVEYPQLDRFGIKGVLQEGKLESLMDDLLEDVNTSCLIGKLRASLIRLAGVDYYVEEGTDFDLIAGDDLQSIPPGKNGYLYFGTVVKADITGDNWDEDLPSLHDACAGLENL
ncbi:MAG: hypothetical protein ABIG95_06610 [Candidatus Woesearchaeota archaeon]